MVMNLKSQVIPGQYENILSLIVLVSTPYSGGTEQRMFYICCQFELDLKAFDVSIYLPYCGLTRLHTIQILFITAVSWHVGLMQWLNH